MMQMDELSSEEQIAVSELRMRMKNALKPDMYEDMLLLYRFLKARDFDVNAAEKMLRKHLVWRKLYQIDTIREDLKPKEFFHKYAKPNFIGTDKDGCLVAYSPGGKIDTKDILRCSTLNDYKKYFAWFGEIFAASIRQQNEITGRNANQAVLILDMDELTLGNATYKLTAEMYLYLVNNYQNNYPEFMKATYVINAPSYYVFVFSIVKAIMSSVMIRKIHVFGHSGWKEKLLEEIDADVLPAFLGGNRTDPDGDPLCRSFITHPGRISPDYFLTDEERYFKDETRVTKILVLNMTKTEICVEAKELGSRIQWEFYSKTNIGFGLFYRESEEEFEEVIPIAKYDTSDGVERGSYKIKSPGKYIIVFDNTYSWLSSKEVEYIIDVVNCES